MTVSWEALTVVLGIGVYLVLAERVGYFLFLNARERKDKGMRVAATLLMSIAIAAVSLVLALLATGIFEAGKKFGWGTVLLGPITFGLPTAVVFGLKPLLTKAPMYLSHKVRYHLNNHRKRKLQYQKALEARMPTKRSVYEITTESEDSYDYY